MKLKLGCGVGIVLFVAAMLFGLYYSRTIAGPYRVNPPTPPPTPTPGEPVFSWGPTTVPLAEPLVTEEQALKRALLIDASGATWDNPWSLDTLKADPGRITLEAFPSRTAETEGSAPDPELDADAGAVWRITIRGSVCLRLGGGLGGDSIATKYDGVTYVISQRHGRVLAVRSGKPLVSTSCPIKTTRTEVE